MKRSNKQHAKIISVEGLNGAGKTVFTTKLKDQLQQRGFSVLVIKAPIYDIQEDGINHFGPDLYSYLNRGTGDISNAQVDIMFRANRLYIQEHIINKALFEYDFLILDRWTMSGAVYSYFRSSAQARIRSNSDESGLILVHHPQLNDQKEVNDKGKQQSLVSCVKESTCKIKTCQDVGTDRSTIKQTEVLPDLCVFIDTDVLQIQYRIQLRTSVLGATSTKNQIYSDMPKLQYIRTLFRCYINQNCHKQKIIILDDSSQTNLVLAVLNVEEQDANNEDQESQTYYSCESDDNSHILQDSVLQDPTLVPQLYDETAKLPCREIQVAPFADTLENKHLVAPFQAISQSIGISDKFKGIAAFQ